MTAQIYKAKDKRKINNALYDLTTNRYFDAIPVAQINAILEPFEMKMEDGIYCGADGHLNEQLADNVWLAMTWHKMPSGRYEIVAYVS